MHVQADLAGLLQGGAGERRRRARHRAVDRIEGVQSGCGEVEAVAVVALQAPVVEAGQHRVLDAIAAEAPLQVVVDAEGLRVLLDRPHVAIRSEEHTSELQSLMRISYAVFCLKKKHKK